MMENHILFSKEEAFGAAISMVVTPGSGANTR